MKIKVDYTSWTKSEMREELLKRGVRYSSKDNRDDLIGKLVKSEKPKKEKPQKLADEVSISSCGIKKGSIFTKCCIISLLLIIGISILFLI